MIRTLKFAVTAAVLLSATTSLVRADDENGFRPLFNGKDLDGWVRVNTAPATWSVEDGMLVCSGKPIGELRTTRMYQNFVLELEWRHLKPRGNAGVFVWADDITARGVPFHRSIEVQVLENAYGNGRGHTTHGDIFPIHGAKMTPVNGRGGSRAFPTENRSKPSPEWNHYRITCNDGEISLAVNGKVVTRGKDCSPRKGYICLESEGGLVHYRNVRIKELPATPVAPEHVATANRDFVTLYNGLDLTGLQTNSKHWQPSDWVLRYTGRDEPDKSWLEYVQDSPRRDFTETDFGVIFDVRLKPDSGKPRVNVRDIEIPLEKSLGDAFAKPGQWNRCEVRCRGVDFTFLVNGREALRFKAIGRRGNITLKPDGPIDFANLFVRVKPLKK